MSSASSRLSSRGFFLGLGLLLAGAVVVSGWLSREPTAPGISPTALYSTRLPDDMGRSVALGQWQGKVLLINFWATWCIPCRAEIPHLVATQARHGPGGLQVIGIAIDRQEKVIPFSAELGINYQVLIAESDGIALSKRLGNQAGIVPFTVLIDRQGEIVATRSGALTQDQIEQMLRDRI